MKGGDGAIKALEKPLGTAMNPLFDYFRVVFDPIYTFVETGVNKYLKDNNSDSLIPKLTTLLHICNNLKPFDTANGGQNTYGVYCIKNVDAAVVGFIKKMLEATMTRVDGLQNDTERNSFNRQLFTLPKVRLTSMLGKYTNTNTYTPPTTIPYIQFLVIDSNLSLEPPKNSRVNSDTIEAIQNYFIDGDLYIVCTNKENASEDIPTNMYEIDFDSIDVAENGIKIEHLPDNYFNLEENKEKTGKTEKTDELFLDKIVSIKPYVVFNDAELALSIFIAFKELMPN
jgi:hypothetical protein